MGHGFCSTDGPCGLWWGSQKRMPAQPGPGTSVAVEENINSAGSTRRHSPAPTQTGPEGRAGQGGRQPSLSRSLPRHWSLVPSHQRLLAVPSPEAREMTAGLWMGQMAGDRPGGTAEWWEVGSGHLARPSDTHLFPPDGGQEWPQQWEEAKVRVGGGQGLPLPHGEPAQGKSLVCV